MSGRIVNVRPKPGFAMDSGGNVIPFRGRDGLTNLVTGLGTRSDARTARTYFAQILSPDQIEQAYEASAMLRKAIRIPALDRVRGGRDWKADQDQIELLEAEEKRLQLWPKIVQAEVLRGLGGGAMILVTDGQHDQPLDVSKQGGLVAINVVSRWHLTGEDWIDDLASPDYGTPTRWAIAGARTQTKIHPSRVVCFRAEPLPSIWRGSHEDRFWGRGRVSTLIEPAQNLDEALATFSAMIKDTMNLDIGITKLLEQVATADGESRLMRRLSLMVQGSSVFNGKLYDLGDETGKGGEKIDRRQLTWTGIPDIIRVYAEALAAASDIPVTRLWGTSAKGLNATGDGDAANYREAIESGRDLELCPCMHQIDAALIPSALGSTPPDVWWEFGELDVMSEKEEAEVFQTVVGAMEKVQMMNVFSELAFAKGAQNTIIEGGWMPGIDAAAAEDPEAERFGLDPGMDPNDPNADPSAIVGQQQGGGDPASAGGGAIGSGPAGRATNDAATWLADSTPRPLYVQRKLLNAGDVIAWAKANGFDSTLAATDMHVTVLYSRQPVDPMKMGRDWSENDKGQIIVRPGGPRVIEQFDGGAVVLRFSSPDLEWRHAHMIEAGGSHDFGEYMPHVTLTYQAPAGVDVTALKPFNGELRFGPEIFEALDLNWKAGVSEE